jgi:cytochrome c oxidase cbb3-type subunit IV
MDAEAFRGIVTLVAFSAYLAVVWWAYSSRNRERFLRDALLPFADEPAAAPVAEVASR